MQNLYKSNNPKRHQRTSVISDQPITDNRTKLKGGDLSGGRDLFEQVFSLPIND